MHKIEIPDREITINIPEHWDEAKPDQACQIFKLAFDRMAEVINKNEYLVRVLFLLTGMKRSWRTVIWEKLAPEEMVLEKNAKIYQMGETLCMWPFADQSEKPQIKFETVKNNLPMIIVGRKKLYGPDDLISNSSFAEFRTAIEEMNAHFRLAKDPETADQSDEALNRFIACLYRPAKKSRAKQTHDDGQIRESFNRAKIDTKYTSQIPIWQKSMILLWFAYCIKYIQTEDLMIDGKIINLSALFPQANANDPVEDDANSAAIGWFGLLIGIAKEGLFGDIEKASSQNIFDIFLYLYDNHLKQQKLNRR